MNREQKRKFARLLTHKGKSKVDIERLTSLFKETNVLGLDDFPKYKEYLLEGDKVKLNIKKITKREEFKKLQKPYKEFVKNNKDTIFTVEYDKKRMDKPNIVCLKEDTSEQKWLFWDGDLLVLDEKDNKFKELFEITED